MSFNHRCPYCMIYVDTQKELTEHLDSFECPALKQRKKSDTEKQTSL